MSGGAHGEEGLGMTVQPLTPSLAQQLEVPRATEGLAVTDVDPDGAAAAAGIQEGDVIRQVNGKNVHSTGELRQAVSAGSGRPASVPGPARRAELLRHRRSRITTLRPGACDDHRACRPLPPSDS